MSPEIRATQQRLSKSAPFNLSSVNMCCGRWWTVNLVRGGGSAAEGSRVWWMYWPGRLHVLLLVPLQSFGTWSARRGVPCDFAPADGGVRRRQLSSHLRNSLQKGPGAEAAPPPPLRMPPLGLSLLSRLWRLLQIQKKKKKIAQEDLLNNRAKNIHPLFLARCPRTPTQISQVWDLQQDPVSSGRPWTKKGFCFCSLSVSQSVK